MTEQWAKTSLTFLKTLWGQQPGGNHQLLGKKMCIPWPVGGRHQHFCKYCRHVFTKFSARGSETVNDAKWDQFKDYLEERFLVFIAVLLLSNLFADNLASSIQTKWDHDIMIATNAVKLLVQHPIYDLFHPTKAKLTNKSGNTQCDWCLPEVTDCSLDLCDWDQNNEKQKGN